MYPTLLAATTGADRDIALTRAASGPHTFECLACREELWHARGGRLHVFACSRFKARWTQRPAGIEERPCPPITLLPGSEQPSQQDHFAQVIGRVVGGQQRLAQDRLPVAVGYFR